MHRGVACALLSAAVLAMAGARSFAAAPYTLIGQSAPDFALRAVNGPNVRLSEHRGDVVVVTFWSSRCAPCGTQLVALERNQRTFRAAGLKVFGVNVDDDQARAVQYASAQEVGFALLLDPDKQVSRRYGIDSLPTTILLDRSGAIRHMHRDYNGKVEARFLKELRTVLNE